MLNLLTRLVGRATRHRRGAGRVVRVNLVLVVAFVLVAVVELTRTWVSAQHIAGNLGTADARLTPIQRNTEQIQRLDRTTQITADIGGASDPLDRQAGRVSATADDIEATVGEIQRQAAAIDARVRDITAAAADIDTTAGRLRRTVNSIEGTATSIESKARGINDSFAALRPVTERINGAGFPDPVGVDSIVTNAKTIGRIAQSIDAYLDRVLRPVRAVNKHAVSIQHSPLVVGGGVVPDGPSPLRLQPDPKRRVGSGSSVRLGRTVERVG